MRLRRLAGAVLSAAALLASGAAGAEPRAPRLLMVVIDGGDWQRLVPCMEEGLCPNLRALVTASAAATIESIPGELSSPTIWTTIATGKTYSKHLVPALEQRPESTDRRVKAIWNVFGEAGWTVAVFGYRVTSPTETVNGVLVSDRFEVFPERAVDVEAPDGPLDFALERWALRDVMAATPADRARARAVAKAYRTDELAVRAAEQVLARRETDLAVVGLLGVDQVSHLTLRFARPAWEAVPRRQTEDWASVSSRYLAQTDAWLGRLLRFCAPETKILVLSDHGMRRVWPREPRLPGTSHGPRGIFIYKSTETVVDGLGEPVSTIDVLPTVLYAAGLAPAADMDGRVILKLFRPELLVRRPIRFLETYERGAAKPSMRARRRRLSGADLEALKELGYLK